MGKRAAQGIFAGTGAATYFIFMNSTAILSWLGKMPGSETLANLIRYIVSLI
jgi:hypothetical protein